jgi:manganese/zinc/iron transport system permease protein
MELGDLLYGLIFDYTLRTVALGSILLGIVAGVLGSFALLRQQSLLGDAVAHAALPGIVAAFLITRSKAPLVLLLGALAAGWLAAFVIGQVVQRTRLKQDSALGVVLSIFFGVGMMMLTFTQRLPDARQAGLDKFLFGQAATLLESDVMVMAGLGGIAVLLVTIFWKEFKLLSFDPDYARSLGYPVYGLDFLLTFLTVVAIVIGLQAVGVILMSAMIVAPAAAARQWTNRLGIMAVLAALFGALAGLSGTLVSTTTAGLSTGPTIVLAASAIALFSILFAPQRGLVAGAVRRWRQSRQVQLEAVLLVMYQLASSHADAGHPHAETVLRAAVPNPASVPVSLRALRERGWVRSQGAGEWALTAQGWENALLLAGERIST